MSDTDTHDAGADTGAEGGADTGAEGFDPATYASQFGWKPKEEWKGDDSKWTDAPEFLKHTFEKTRSTAENTKKRMEDNNRINARLLAEEKKRSEAAIRDAEARIELAAEEGDAEAAKAATKDLRAETVKQDIARAQAAFAKDHPWFGVDKKATRLAGIAAAELLEETGGKATYEEQFEAAAEAVREAMPHLFEDGADDGDDEPKATKKPPHVERGSRTPPLKRGPKGWADIPDADRRIAKKTYVDKGILTEAEYSKSYWTEKGEAA